MSILDKIYKEVLLIVRSGADLDHVRYFVNQREWFELEKELLNLKRYTYLQSEPTWLPLTEVHVYGMRVMRK